MDENRPPSHSLPLAGVVRLLDVDPAKGLDASEVARRRRLHGPNELQTVARVSRFRVFVNQFKSLIMALLGAAMFVAFLFGDVVDAAAILVLLLLNVAIGFTMEIRAARSVEALRKIGRVRVTVRRGGHVARVAAQELVPGDVVLVEAGDVVAADLRLVTASRLEADESTLTGESVPVTKDPGQVSGDAILAERRNSLYKGTFVTRGQGECVVVATGMRTELGRISQLVQEAEDEATPLEKRLEALGRRLVYAVLVIAVLVTGLGVLRGKDAVLMVEISIALAVAAVPEGLPIVATLALARGVLRMARRNALVKRLSAVETLGSTAVVFVDKTGTLTENRMTVQSVVALGGSDVPPEGAQGSARAALEVGVLCNSARWERGSEGSGDPMELALLVAGAAAGLERAALLQARPEVRVEAFDPARRMMATVHRDGNAFWVAVKGAPEAVLAACTSVAAADGERSMTVEDRREIEQAILRQAESGMRLLAAAGKRASSAEAPAFEGLTLLGLIAMQDPPRMDVADSVAVCQRAGIRVVMATGDHVATARSIAAQVGIVGQRQAPALEGRELAAADPERVRATRVFARVSPEQKLSLIALHQAAGQVVAMTGDGVNDAPALRKADIGVAMGGRGTEVAREAADLVLKDDAFPTIVEAVRQGRIIFSNIRTFAYYLLSCNVGEVAIIAVASAFTQTLPLLPLQILFLNLVTDVFPALALGFGEGDRRTMLRPPRPASEPFLTGAHWWGVVGYGAAFTVSVLAAFLLALGPLEAGAAAAVTVSFFTLALAQLWHVFNMRGPGSGLLRNDVVRNPYVWGALALCVALLGLVAAVPSLSRVLSLVPLDASLWLVVAVCSLIPLVGGQVVRPLVRGLP